MAIADEYINFFSNNPTESIANLTLGNPNARMNVTGEKLPFTQPGFRATGHEQLNNLIEESLKHNDPNAPSIIEDLEKNGRWTTPSATPDNRDYAYIDRLNDPLYDDILKPYLKNAIDNINGIGSGTDMDLGSMLNAKASALFPKNPVAQQEYINNGLDYAGRALERTRAIKARDTLAAGIDERERGNEVARALGFGTNQSLESPRTSFWDMVKGETYPAISQADKDNLRRLNVLDRGDLGSGTVRELNKLDQDYETASAEKLAADSRATDMLVDQMKKFGMDSSPSSGRSYASDDPTMSKYYGSKDLQGMKTGTNGTNGSNTGSNNEPSVANKYILNVEDAMGSNYNNLLDSGATLHTFHKNLEKLYNRAANYDSENTIPGFESENIEDFVMKRQSDDTIVKKLYQKITGLDPANFKSGDDATAYSKDYQRLRSLLNHIKKSVNTGSDDRLSSGAIALGILNLASNKNFWEDITDVTKLPQGYESQIKNFRTDLDAALNRYDNYLDLKDAWDEYSQIEKNLASTITIGKNNRDSSKLYKDADEPTKYLLERIMIGDKNDISKNYDLYQAYAKQLYQYLSRYERPVRQSESK